MRWRSKADVHPYFDYLTTYTAAHAPSLSAGDKTIQFKRWRVDIAPAWTKLKIVSYWEIAVINSFILDQLTGYGSGSSFTPATRFSTAIKHILVRVVMVALAICGTMMTLGSESSLSSAGSGSGTVTSSAA